MTVTRDHDPPADLNCAAFFQQTQTIGDTGAPDAEDASQSAVGQRHTVLTQGIARHQQPSREPLFDIMIGIANAGLNGLQQHEVYVSQQYPAYTGACVHDRDKVNGSDFESFATDLHHPLQWWFAIVQQDRNSAHALRADKPRLHHLSLSAWARHGNEGVFYEM